MLCNIDVKDFPVEMQDTPKEELVRSYINHKDETGKTPLHYASLKGATLSCMHLLKVSSYFQSQQGKDMVNSLNTNPTKWSSTIKTILWG